MQNCISYCCFLAIYLIFTWPVCKLFHVKPGIRGTRTLCDYTMYPFFFFFWSVSRVEEGDTEENLGCFILRHIFWQQLAYISPR